MKRMVNVLFAGVLAMTVLSCGEEKKRIYSEWGNIRCKEWNGVSEEVSG